MHQEPSRNQERPTLTFTDVPRLKTIAIYCAAAGIACLLVALVRGG